MIHKSHSENEEKDNLLQELGPGAKHGDQQCHAAAFHTQAAKMQEKSKTQ
jgi:hypothetical protein